MSDFDSSAAGSLAGFVWQVRRALLTLLRAPEAASVGIETDDDIVLVTHPDAACVCVQTKHSFGNGLLSSKSKDFWKTIRVWLDRRNAARFELVTTRPVSDDLLCLGASATRDPDAIAELSSTLDAIASAASNSELTKAYNAWLAADIGVRRSVLERCTVLTEQRPLSAIDDEIESELRRVGVAAASAKRASKTILGWFDRVVAERLSMNGCRIARDELQDELRQIHIALASVGALVVTTAGAPALEIERQNDPLYLRQLDLLGATDEILTLAVDTHHAAVVNRQQWLDEKLLAQQALDSFDTDLRVRWTRCRTSALRSSSADDVKCGWLIFEKCCEQTCVIAGQQAHSAIVEGTFHVLAETPRDSPSVGWHPKFESLLFKKS